MCSLHALLTRKLELWCCIVHHALPVAEEQSCWVLDIVFIRKAEGSKS
jgi:hypothetical protein